MPPKVSNEKNEYLLISRHLLFLNLNRKTNCIKVHLSKQGLDCGCEVSWLEYCFFKVQKFWLVVKINWISLL
mgnify:CR=1 FL=1